MNNSTGTSSNDKNLNNNDFQNTFNQNQSAESNSEYQNLNQPSQINQNGTVCMSLSSVSVLWHKSAEMYKANFWKMIGMVTLPFLGILVLVAILMLYGFLSSSLTLMHSIEILPIINIIFGFLGILILIGIIYLGIITKAGIYILTKEADKNLSLKQAFGEAKKFAVGVFLINMLSGIFVILWSLLFIIPGIIAALCYSLATWSYLCEGFTGTKTLKRSKELIKGYWWAVFGRFFAVFGTYYVLIITISSFFEEESLALTIFSILVQITVIIITPLLVIYSYLIYLDLRKIKGESEIKEKKGNGFWIVIVFFVLMILLTFMIAPSLYNAQQKAKDAKVLTDLDNIAICIEIYKSDTAELPKSLNELSNLSDKKIDRFKYCLNINSENYIYERFSDGDYILCENVGDLAVVPKCRDRKGIIDYSDLSK